MSKRRLNVTLLTGRRPGLQPDATPTTERAQWAARSTPHQVFPLKVTTLRMIYACARIRGVESTLQVGFRSRQGVHGPQF